jgi:hypothetical protein
MSLDWLRVEYAIEKPSNKLLALTELDPNTWVSEVKRIRGKKQPLSPTGLGWMIQSPRDWDGRKCMPSFCQRGRAP